ncbi:predicted protein [Botrytis cinerea T4]|uniref:Uncharacterized protein n=1 Tax=Botryotinia fuckeliana (strain T4) TaxID=999810 RepID=G2YFH2_BOTF4|nr:predicted protein [Botrytis cinerea T4]
MKLKEANIKENKCDEHLTRFGNLRDRSDPSTSASSFPN